MKRLPLYIFFTANAISMIGNRLTLLAVPWFVLETSGSATKIGLVGFFTALPAVLAAFFGGALVDRLGYKRMSIISDLASGLTVALIPWLYVTTGLQFWQLLVLVFFSALLDAPGNTARQALLPDLAALTDTPLERVNAWAQTVQRSAGLIGPAVAGLLITSLGSNQVLWFDAASFVISALLFAIAVPAGQALQVAPSAYLTQLADGLRFVRHSRLIFSLVLTVAITNFLDVPIFAVIMPVYTKQIYGDAAWLGLLLSCFGAGAVIGGLVYGTVGQYLSRRVTFIVSFILVGLPFWVLALKPPLPLAVAALLWVGLAAGPINPLLMTVFQEKIPPEMRGRVFGMLMAITLVAAPLGMVLTGYLVERLTVTTTLLIIAVCYLLVTLSQIFNPILRDMDYRQPIQGYI